MHDADIKRGEVTQKALELIATVDEALVHMDKQLTELRLEDFWPLFRDFLLAVATLADNWEYYVTADSDRQRIVEATRAFAAAYDEFDKIATSGQAPAIQAALNDRLVPAYQAWKAALVGGSMYEV
ncbi:hypothetical protein TcarDRAFT_0767 [Thermosinus carboxydivorans Nor1]|uniref:DUF8042 domain-containing protein n=1 Tax=Thermosinus carboxydivorans Nor1 TaxID=401526 RepID=A1HT38_9FIRM|nr:hypothetical protein [Thermosinus carboxydivorans]EAX46803.1 hypothetical protein TcarDRAFT_0767 [Thermosinus carboxydivorans Nor1]